SSTHERGPSIRPTPRRGYAARPIRVRMPRQLTPIPAGRAYRAIPGARVAKSADFCPLCPPGGQCPQFRTNSRQFRPGTGIRAGSGRRQRLAGRIPALDVGLEDVDELPDEAIAAKGPVELAVDEDGCDRVLER